MFQIIWTNIPRNTKYKSNPRHKAIYNYIMPYFIVMMITSLEFFRDKENKQINFWLKRNPIVLDKMIMNIWNKGIIDLEYR